MSETNETPVSDPVVETAPVVDAAPVETAPVVETVVETPAAPALHTDTPTLLSDVEDPKSETPAEEVKPEEPKPDEAKVEDPKPEEPKAEEVVPVTYEFTAPEGVTIDAAKLEPFIGVLKEHGIAPDVGQKMFDLYTAEQSRQAQESLANMHRVFADTRQSWRDQIMGDPELGGSGFETVKKAVARARDRLVPEGDRAAFNEFMLTTGAGDNPAFWRLLYRAANVLDEPVSPPDERRPAPQPGAARTGFDALFKPRKIG